MTSLLEPPAAQNTHTNPAQTLRTEMAAMRLSFTWFGVRKALSSEQKAEAADTFGAQGEFLSAGKKLVDTRDKAFRAVTQVRHKCGAYWRSLTLPFPEPGLRLVKRDDIDAMNSRMGQFREQLSEAVEALNDRLQTLKSQARERLGRLYSPLDYPDALLGLFDLTWEFPNVEPPNYLRQLAPEIYRQECDRVKARFNEALQLAEQSFYEELSRLVSHLTERLSGSQDGKPKIFRDSAIENLDAFFERFRHLNIGGNDQLEELIAQARQTIAGVQPQTLRENAATRQQVASQLAGIQSVLDGVLVDRPRRNIIRRSH